MRTWIKNPIAIYTANELDARNGVVVEDKEVVELVAAGQHPTEIYDQVFDASQHVITPGLVNTHHHFYQTLTRAQPAALNKKLFPWLQSLYPIWAGLDEEMIKVSTKLASAELLLSGCTTASDHHYIFPEAAPHALDNQVEAIREIGIRAVLTRGSMSLGEDQGGLPPRSTVQTEEVILQDCERTVKQYHDASHGSVLQIALAPCSPFSVSEYLMRETAALARSMGVRLHTHLAETHDEIAFCLQQFGDRPVDYLERVGWLADDVWLAHGIHFNPEEINRLGNAKVGISHCPSSNMLLSSGLCQTLALQQAGCPVGIGVDGSASNDGSNLIQEVRQAFLLQRLNYDADQVSHTQSLEWATSGSAKCLGRQDIGELAVGKMADISLFKVDEPRFSGAGDMLASIVLCGAHKADYVMVDGQWLVEEGEIPHLDMPQLLHQHKQAAAALLNS
ncbi:MAG: 8-oxoguanine deaminase [Saprospiraceae bacterium]|jgi:8-oxoguanine deaminase